MSLEVMFFIIIFLSKLHPTANVMFITEDFTRVWPESSANTCWDIFEVNQNFSEHLSIFVDLLYPEISNTLSIKSVIFT